jgi:hypothetical protein
MCLSLYSFQKMRLDKIHLTLWVLSIHPLARGGTPFTYFWHVGTIDDFRGEISQMGEILGFQFLKGQFFIHLVFKKIRIFSPYNKIKDRYGN